MEKHRHSPARLFVAADSAEARHLHDGRRWRFVLKSRSEGLFSYAVDPSGENWLAYQSGTDSVEIRSLKTGRLVTSKVFKGENILDMHFLGNTDQLLLSHFSAAMQGVGAIRRSVRIWSPFQTGERPRALRMGDYQPGHIAVDASGRRAALSDGLDIRIFDLENPENESLFGAWPSGPTRI
jgi:hypothetical protein